MLLSHLQRIAKEGTEGRKKITQWTRYLTVVLAFIQAIGVSVGMFRQALVSTDFFSVAVIVIVLSAGTAFLMWLGEQINENGIGNGISLIIFGGIVARIPSGIHTNLGQIPGWRIWLHYHSNLLSICYRSHCWHHHEFSKDKEEYRYNMQKEWLEEKCMVANPHTFR